MPAREGRRGVAPQRAHAQAARCVKLGAIVGLSARYVLTRKKAGSHGAAPPAKYATVTGKEITGAFEKNGTAERASRSAPPSAKPHSVPARISCGIRFH